LKMNPKLYYLKIHYRHQMIFNSACSIRNNILHQDATPSLDVLQVMKFKQHFETFAIKLDSHLCDYLYKMKIEDFPVI
jgi:hypothetical protein